MSKCWIALAFTATLGIGASVPARAQDATSPSGPSSAAAATIERGRYLVHDAAMCVQCHSPRTNDGTILEQQWMRGGPVWVERPAWTEKWAPQAPDVVAIARGRADYLVTILTTGQRPDGTKPKAPMPPFRLTDEDAQAVVAYLETLR